MAHGSLLHCRGSSTVIWQQKHVYQVGVGGLPLHPTQWAQQMVHSLELFKFKCQRERTRSMPGSPASSVIHQFSIMPRSQPRTHAYSGKHRRRFAIFSAQLKSFRKQGHSNLVAASAYLTSGGKFHGLTTWPGAASSGALLEQTE